MANTFNEKTIKVIIKRLINAKDPELAIKQLFEKISAVRNLIVKDEIDGSPMLSSQQIGGSLIAGSAIIYWSGWLILPLWIPALAAFAGTIGALGIISGFKWWQDGHRNWIFIKTYYSFLYLIEMADGVITAEESRYLQDFILSLPLSNSQRKELFGLKVETIDNIDLPNWLEQSHREAILAGCWSLAYCDDLAEQEIKMLENIANALQINHEKAQEIKNQIIKEIDLIEDLLICIGKEILLLQNKFNYNIFIDLENLYNIFTEINARGNSYERIKSLINDNNYNNCYTILSNNEKLLELVLVSVQTYFEIFQFMIDSTKHQDLVSKLSARYKELANKEVPNSFIKILNDNNKLLSNLVSNID